MEVVRKGQDLVNRYADGQAFSNDSLYGSGIGRTGWRIRVMGHSHWIYGNHTLKRWKVHISQRNEFDIQPFKRSSKTSAYNCVVEE